MKKEKKKENKKTNKKVLIPVIISIALLLVLITVLIFNLVEKKRLKEPIKESWGQTYYVYLRDKFDGEKKEIAGETLPEIKDYKINFYAVNGIKDPVMVMNYESKKDTYTNIYYIYNNEVQTIRYFSPTTVELLYNINTKEYNYYTHNVSDGKEYYEDIGPQIQNYINSANNVEAVPTDQYVFSEGEKRTVKDVNGNEISIDKFDETFIKPEVKDEAIEFSTDISEKDLKQKVESSIDLYATLEQVAKKMAQQTNEILAEVEKKQKQMADAQAEVEKKAAEEKARLEAQGIQIGTYTLKYGRYEWDLADLGAYGQKETYILRSDKTCTYTDMDGKTTSCTFSVGKGTDGQSVESAVVRDALVIKQGGYDRHYFPTTGGFRDTDLEYFKYKGAN